MISSREKVIDAWKRIADADFLALVNDTIELLEKRGKQKFLANEDGATTPIPDVVLCRDCIYYVCANVDHIVGCEWCRLTRTIKKPDWFCADGERKE